MIYLASPHGHPSGRVMESRENVVHALAGALIAHGLPVFSPIVYGVALRDDVGNDFTAWNKHNFAMVWRCREFWIADIDGWLGSNGIACEAMHHRKSFGTQCRFVKHIWVLDHEKASEILESQKEGDPPIDVCQFTRPLLNSELELFELMAKRWHDEQADNEEPESAGVIA